MSGSVDMRLTNPFPGLRPFREEEEHLFFGREGQIDAIVDKLAAKRFLAVVGTSGSGKSVNAIRFAETRLPLPSGSVVTPTPTLPMRPCAWPLPVPFT